MTKAFCFKHVLSFNNPSGTSRGVLNQKTSWFIVVKNEKKIGIGECSLIEGLSPDPMESYEETLNYTCENIHLGFDVISKKLQSYPSILFGLESAFLSLNSISPFSIFPSDFTKHKDNIAINGLVWMGDKAFMRSQVIEKINAGFDCIKIKIGAIDFNTELELLKNIRREFSEKDIEIRVDANGAFNYEEALKNLSLLDKLKIHSIEQPIMPNQWEKMSLLCEKSPIDIALDEELINVSSLKQKEMLLSIKPKYIILKPSLIGGLKKAEDWIDLAEKNDIKWWATSALESNVGLNIIAQWVYQKSSSMKQGLGTGKLYSNNITSPHYIKKGCLYHNPKIEWNMNFLKSLFKNGIYFNQSIRKNNLKKRAFLDNNLLSSELYHFLKDWFSKKEFICVKTSGSTGSPKTIKLSKKKMIASAIKTGNFLKLNPGDKALCCLPIDYIAGKMMVVRSIVLGLDLTIAKPSKSPFSKLSSNYDFSACTPHQLEGSTKNLSKIKILLIGGSPVNETLKKQLQNCKNTIYETFGMTETISHIALKNITTNEQNFKALEGVSFKSIEGCLKIICPDLLKKPLITNDLVEIFSEKEFSWIGRKDFVVNSGGIKLFPEKIERKLSKFLKDPFVVIGIPDESLGEKLVIVFEGKVSTDYQKAIESLNKYEKPKRSFDFIKFKRLNNKVIRNEVLKKILKINESKQ